MILKIGEVVLRKDNTLMFTGWYIDGTDRKSYYTQQELLNIWMVSKLQTLCGS